VQPRADMGPPGFDLHFDDAEPLLLTLLADDVEDGYDLAPTLLAFVGDRALGLVRLRPHEPGEIVDVLIEILALLLPLGMDRAVLALPGRAWSLDGASAVPWDPAGSPSPAGANRRDGHAPDTHETSTSQDGPGAGDEDPRQPVAVVVIADGSRGLCQVRSRLHPLRIDAGGSCTWLPVIEPEGPVDAPAIDVLRILLDHREGVAADAGPGERIAAQFGRVLLLGHEISLAPVTTRRLLAATTASG
jgi:hypothetical protein